MGGKERRAGPGDGPLISWGLIAILTGLVRTVILSFPVDARWRADQSHGSFFCSCFLSYSSVYLVLHVPPPPSSSFLLNHVHLSLSVFHFSPTVLSQCLSVTISLYCLYASLSLLLSLSLSLSLSLIRSRFTKRCQHWLWPK